MLKNLAFVAASLVAVALLAPTPVRACDGEEGHQQAAVPNVLTVDQLAAKIDASKKDKKPLAIFDVNSAETRASKGIIPAAVLLPSSSEYDVALLPKDKAQDVVFYCAAEKCSASKGAAKRALEAGHTAVHVLPAGIAGWVKAGKPVAKQPQV